MVQRRETEIDILRENQKEIWTVVRKNEIDIAIIKTKIAIVSGLTGLASAIVVELLSHLISKH